MKKLTKESLGKAFLGIAEFTVENLESDARRFAKDKRFTDDQRDAYSQMTDNLGRLRQTIQDKRGLKKANEYSDEFFEEEPQDTFEDTDITESIPTEEKSIRISYFNQHKEHQQALEASSDNDFGKYTIEEWDKLWISYGRLDNVVIEETANSHIGLIALKIGTKIIFIIRAIDLRNGGIGKKLKELCSVSLLRSKMINQLIADNFHFISVEVLEVGTDESTINVVRNLERQMILIHHPDWN